jgi:NhaP-type Na+/H+ or K+/H+ antiporter
MLPVALSMLGSGLTPTTVAFLGWFGPRGLASILFVLLVVEPGRLERGELLESVVALTVLLSTLLHGATAYPLAGRYGDYASAAEAAEAERKRVMDLPVRIRHHHADSGT